jgi:GT2 family glycosyltransferase
MVELSVVLVSWNSRDYLRRCLLSLVESRPNVAWEIIVVDNGSTDGSLEMIRREFPAVKVIENNSNLGFAVSANLGARESTSDYILFLNPDTIVHPRTLILAINFMEKRKDSGIMGCRTLGGDGQIQPTAFDFPSPFRMFGFASGLNRCFKITRLKDFTRIRTPDYIQGSFLLIRRAAYESIGGFDEAFFMYAEDVDLCLRVRQAGWKIYFAPAMTITHFGSGSTLDSLAALESFIRSLIILYKKHKSPGDLEKLRWALRGGLLLNAFFWASHTLLHLKPFRKEDLRTYRHLMSLLKAS